MLTNDELRQIEERESQASPGPWTIGFNGSLRSAWAVQKAGTTTPILHCDPDKNTELHEVTHQVEADLDFIAFSRSDVKSLLEEVKRLKALVLEGRDVLEFYASPGHYRPPAAGTNVVWVGNDLGTRAREYLLKE